MIIGYETVKNHTQDILRRIGRPIAAGASWVRNDLV
jgi:hypothetical protein